MTLAELAVTVAMLGALGLVARRFGLSAIPAYLLAGLLLGPSEPTELYLISPSEVTSSSPSSGWCSSSSSSASSSASSGSRGR